MTEPRSIEDVYEKTLDIHGDVLALREDFFDLKEHVNDELELMNAEIKTKVSSSDLLSSLGFKLLANKAVRWGLGVIATTAVGTIAAERWVPWLHELIGLATGV